MKAAWWTVAVVMACALQSSSALRLANTKSIDRCKTDRVPPTYMCKPMSAPGEGVLPDFIIASADKTGSTGMFRDLTLGHGMISNMISCKEMRFFSNNRYFDDNGTCDISVYQQLFPKPCSIENMIYGEASPSYFSNTAAATRISSILRSRTRILIFTRSPLKRFLSRMIGNYEHQKPPDSHLTCRDHITQFFARSHECEKNTSSTCIVDEPTGLWFDSETAIGKSLYISVLESIWDKHFSSSQVLVLPIELFNPMSMSEKVVQDAHQHVAAFLGIRPWTTEELDKLPSKKLLAGSSHSSHYAEAVDNPRSHWATVYRQKAGRNWNCEAEDFQKLQTIFAPYNARLLKMWERSALHDNIKPEWYPLRPEMQEFSMLGKNDDAFDALIENEANDDDDDDDIEA